MGIFDSKPSQNPTSRAIHKQPKKIVVSVGNDKGYPASPAVKDAREIIQDARDEAFRIKKAAEEETRKIRQEILDLENRVAQKETSLESKLSQITKLERQVESGRKTLEKREQEITKTRSELVDKLSKVSSLTREEARKLILSNLEEELKGEVAKRIKEAEEKENTNKDKDPEDTEGVKFYCKHCDGVNIIGTTLLKKLINQNLKVR